MSGARLHAKDVCLFAKVYVSVFECWGEGGGGGFEWLCLYTFVRLDWWNFWIWWSGKSSRPHRETLCVTDMKALGVFNLAGDEVSNNPPARVMGPLEYVLHGI